MGALSEDAAQVQEDKDRQRQKDDGVKIHVVFALWFFAMQKRHGHPPTGVGRRNEIAIVILGLRRVILSFAAKYLFVAAMGWMARLPPPAEG